MKRFLSILSFCALMAAHTASADIHYVNVDPTKVFVNTVIGSDWDDTLAKDHSNLGKKARGFVIGGFRLAKASEGRKEARVNGEPLEGLVAHLDYMIARKPKLALKREKLMQNLNKAKPHVELIAYIQQLQARGIKLIIATNNDLATLRVKTRKLNFELRKKGRKPLTYAGVYCAGSCPEIKNGKTPEGLPAGSVWRGKFTDEYFEKLFRFAETEFGYDRKNTLFVFVDDLKINIDRACKVAKREGVALIAVHKNKSDKKIVCEMKAALSSLKIKSIKK
jgi:hypothetical protein